MWAFFAVLTAYLPCSCKEHEEGFYRRWHSCGNPLLLQIVSVYHMLWQVAVGAFDLLNVGSMGNDGCQILLQTLMWRSCMACWRGWPALKLGRMAY